MAERQYNEVTCDVCGKKKTCDIGKCPVDMTGKIVLNMNVFYENRSLEYSNVCTDCMNKITAFVRQKDNKRRLNKWLTDWKMKDFR